MKRKSLGSCTFRRSKVKTTKSAPPRTTYHGVDAGVKVEQGQPVYRIQAAGVGVVHDSGEDASVNAIAVAGSVMDAVGDNSADEYTVDGEKVMISTQNLGSLKRHVNVEVHDYYKFKMENSAKL